jgi:hypothetical protein
MLLPTKFTLAKPPADNVDPVVARISTAARPQTLRNSFWSAHRQIPATPAAREELRLESEGYEHRREDGHAE